MGAAQEGGGPLARATEWLWNRAVAALLLCVLSPILLLTAAAIGIDSRGPVIFRQTRVGSRRVQTAEGRVWESRFFDVFKFRSMYHGTDQGPHREYVQRYVEGTLSGGDEGFKMTEDPRITRVGRIIRRLSIDELPQLVNVLLGDMNLVGPRPVPAYEVEGYSPQHMERLHAMPGITGHWQVHGRGRVSFEEMVDMDIWYARHRSFLLDLRLLLATIPAVLGMKGAR
jgi:lipopolysaccharide/colanic/teichoic acid biosynthesis glycosyltransferase